MSDSAPSSRDIGQCVACGLCLPHCPTFRVTGKETASPRGRIAAMRAVVDEGAPIDATFIRMMDECLACRACEAACPSGVPFGRMIEGARALAYLRGRQYVLPEDITDLAVDTLRHRLVLSYEALAEGLDADGVVARVMAHVPVPDKPMQHAEGAKINA